MLGAGFPAWHGGDSGAFEEDWSRRLSGAKLEREKTVWGTVLAEILSAASPDSRVRERRVWIGFIR